MTLVEVDPAPDVPATLLTISPSQSEILELDIGQTFTLTLAQLPRASVNVSARSKRRTDDPR